MAKSRRGRGRPKDGLEVGDEVREDLSRLERGRTVSQALALRARMILRCAEGKDDTQVARELDLDRNTVGKWRRRFMRQRYWLLASIRAADSSNCEDWQ